MISFNVGHSPLRCIPSDTMTREQGQDAFPLESTHPTEKEGGGAFLYGWNLPARHIILEH